MADSDPHENGERTGQAAKEFVDKSVQNPDVDCTDETESPDGSVTGLASASGKHECGVGRQSVDKRKFRSLTFGRRYKGKGKELTKKRKGPWNFKLNCCRMHKSLETDIPEPNVGCGTCVCTGYRRTEEHHLGAGVVFEATPPAERRSCWGTDYTRFAPKPDESANRAPVIDLRRFNPDEYPIDDWDERARVERAREIEEGIEPPPGYHPVSPVPRNRELQMASLAAAFQNRLSVNAPHHPYSETPLVGNASISTEMLLTSHFEHVNADGTYMQRTIHTQVDYIHCLVPDLMEITSCSFYWGKMDRYEAEKLLENRPEGTFLLRDSAQEEYLFSVSFRRYSRSLHARIEQWNHKFSFDSHDPGVFSSYTVCGLIEHYKDPSCCMFFEPMLTIPLHRTFTFPLKHLCRAVISSYSSYDGVNQLQLPKLLKSYLKEYHYKQRVRVRRFEVEQ